MTALDDLAVREGPIVVRLVLDLCALRLEVKRLRWELETLKAQMARLERHER